MVVMVVLVLVLVTRTGVPDTFFLLLVLNLRCVPSSLCNVPTPFDVCQTEVECLEFNGFGKQAITELNCSPDAFIQLGYAGATGPHWRHLKAVSECVGALCMC